MDVRFCRMQEPQPRGTHAQRQIQVNEKRALQSCAQETPAFPLTGTYMDVGRPELIQLAEKSPTRTTGVPVVPVKRGLR
jgi:hypothetical protein